MRRGAAVVGLLLLLAAVGCARVPPPHPTSLPVAAGEPAWRTTVEAATATPIVPGHAVEILVNGREIVPAMLAAIASAQGTITYEQFTWHEGVFSQRLTAALAERCRAGVRVHVLMDYFGGRPPAHEQEVMEDAGCEVAIFRPPRLTTLGRFNYRTHRRILVIDGRLAFTGGSGVGPRWFGEANPADRFRDTDVRLEGPAVSRLQAAFAEHWREATGRRLGGEAYYPRLTPAGGVDVQVVTSAPHAGDHAVYTLYMTAIAGARRSISISNQYLLLDRPMTDALLRAVERGVDVVIVVPDAPTNLLVYAASLRDLGELLRGGVEVYGYHAKGLHAKTMVVDGLWATIGTANLDPRSFAINAEINVAVHDRAVAAFMEALFAEDLAGSRRLTYEAWQERSVWLRLFGLLLRPLRSQL